MLLKSLTVTAFVLGVTGVINAQDRLVVETDRALLVRGDFQQRPDVRYRLFKTRNNWTFLELDTATGQMWQLQFSVDKAPPGRWVLNSTVLAQNGKPGRFTLYETPNNWNFILLDQDTGYAWQAQFSLDDNSLRGILEFRDVAPAAPSPETP